jgi:hypothetical protein
LNHSLRAGPVRRWRARNRYAAKQFEFGFLLSSKPRPAKFKHLEFPWLLRRCPRTERKNFRSLSDLPRCYARRSAQSFERIIAAVLETRVWNSCCLSPGSSGFSVDTNPARIRPMSLRRRTLFLSESRFERIAQETQAGLESVLSQAINE